MFNMSAAWNSAHVELVFAVAITPRSPDLFSCDFFLEGYVKGLVFVLPLPANIEEMKERITAALDAVTEDMLQRVTDSTCAESQAALILNIYENLS